MIANRLQICDNCCQNSVNRIFYHFVVTNLFRGVDERYIRRYLSPATAQPLLAEAVSLFCSPTQQIAHIGTLMITLRNREQNPCRELLIRFGVYYIPERIDKTAVTA